MHKGTGSLYIYTTHIIKSCSGSNLEAMGIVDLVASTYHSHDLYFGFWRLWEAAESGQSATLHLE